MNALYLDALALALAGRVDVGDVLEIEFALVTWRS
jgi:hypothetical protein